MSPLADVAMINIGSGMIRVDGERVLDFCLAISLHLRSGSRIDCGPFWGVDLADWWYWVAPYEQRQERQVA